VRSRRNDGPDVTLASGASPSGTTACPPGPGDLALFRRRARGLQLDARRALMSYRDALYRSAQAHDRAASAHQRAARMTGDAIHEQMTAFHRAAAAEDRYRAGQIQA